MYSIFKSFSRISVPSAVNGLLRSTVTPLSAGARFIHVLPRDEIESKVLNVVSKYCHKNINLQLGSSFAYDLGMDSLDFIELQMKIEDEFPSFEFKDLDYSQLNIVSDIVKKIIEFDYPKVKEIIDEV